MSWRKIATQVLLWTIAACVFAALAFGHMDLWIRRGGEDGLAVEWNRRVLFPALSAAGLLVALAAINFLEIVRVLASRRALAALNVGVMVILSGGIAVFLNAIAARHYFVGDWTFKGIYSITERTESVVDGLKEPVRVHVVASPFHELYSTIRGTLDMYRAAAPQGMLEVVTIDPSQERDRLKRTLEEELGVNPKELDEPEVVIFSVGGGDGKKPRTKQVPFTSIVEIDYSGGGPRGGRLKGFKAEELFTEAILSLTRPKQSSLYVLTGHDEIEVFGGRADERLGEVERRLKNLGWKVETFGFDFAPESKKADVPADCDVLLVAGPRSRFEDRELERLRAWLDRGGRLLVLGDPEKLLRQRPGTRSFYFDDTRLDILLAPYGLALEPSYVYDPTAAVMDFTFAPTIRGVSENHAVTKPLVGLKLIFANAQGVIVSPTADAEVRNQAILETSAGAIAVRDMNAAQRTGNPFSADHRKGPIALAAVATKPVEVTPTAAPDAPTGTAEAPPVKGEARIAVVGDATFATDEVAMRVPPNMDLLLNLVAWLGAREESIAIGSKAPEIIRLRLDGDQRTRAMLVIIEIPLVCLFLALAVYGRRRS